MDTEKLREKIADRISFDCSNIVIGAYTCSGGGSGCGDCVGNNRLSMEIDTLYRQAFKEYLLEKAEEIMKPDVKGDTCLSSREIYEYDLLIRLANSLTPDTVCQWCGSPAKVEKADKYTTFTCQNPDCKAVGVMS